MPVLNRYDAGEDELRPASAAVWRYDASSDSGENGQSETLSLTKCYVVKMDVHVHENHVEP